VSVAPAPTPAWDELGKALGVGWTAEGSNYTFGFTASNRAVWRRPDLSSAEGARCAEEMGLLLRSAASRGDVLGMMFDLREAPFIAGPRTEEALAQMLGAWAQAKKRAAIVISDAPMQQLQMKRLIERHNPKFGLATPVFADAKRHLGIWASG